MMNPRLIAQREFRRNARDRTVGIDAIAGFETPDIRTNRFDDSTRVGSRRIRQIRLPRISPGANVRIDRIDARCFHTHQHLSGIRLRIRHVFNFQDFRTTKLAHSYGFHVLRLPNGSLYSTQMLSSFEKPRLYDCMKPSTTSGFIAVSMDNPAMEIEDLEQLVRQYRTRVQRFVFASVRDWDLAETLTQDCFWKAYRNRKTFRGDCSINTWLMRIAVNLVRDHTRSRRFQFWKKAGRVDCGDS